MKKNQSFLIEIFAVGPSAGKGVTICGREVMTLSGRCRGRAVLVGPIGSRTYTLRLIAVAGAGGELAVFFAATWAGIGRSATWSRVGTAALIAHLCS
jgi:hypothetical protein